MEISVIFLVESNLKMRLPYHIITGSRDLIADDVNSSKAKPSILALRPVLARVWGPSDLHAFEAYENGVQPSQSQAAWSSLCTRHFNLQPPRPHPQLLNSLSRSSEAGYGTRD